MERSPFITYFMSLVGFQTVNVGNSGRWFSL